VGPERNVREFLATLPEWRRLGLLAFTLNLQGGNPKGLKLSLGRTPRSFEGATGRPWTIRASGVPIGWVVALSGTC
jgi:hypothetical protein